MSQKNCIMFTKHIQSLSIMIMIYSYCWLKSNKKDFAIDRTINRPSVWIRSGKSEQRGSSALTQGVVNHIKKFILFIGYPRSGHSIVGSLMDAHPHMVIANEFLLLRNWKYFSDREKEYGESNPFYKHKSYLFNTLYRWSYWDTTDGFRSEQNTKKNYTLSIDSSLWQGKFDKYNIYIYQCHRR